MRIRVVSTTVAMVALDWPSRKARSTTLYNNALTEQEKKRAIIVHFVVDET